MKILQLFMIMVIASCLFTLIIYKVSMYKMKKEKLRNLIMCELIKIEGECIEYLNTHNLRDFPKIEKQMREVTLILNKITYDARIDNIKLVRIKDDDSLIREYELLDREKKRLNDENVNSILLRKTIIINGIAQYNFPLVNLWTIIINILLTNETNDDNVKCKTPKSFYKEGKRTLQYKVA